MDYHSGCIPLCSTGRHRRIDSTQARQVVLVLVCRMFPYHTTFWMDSDVHGHSGRLNALIRNNSLRSSQIQFVIIRNIREIRSYN